MNLSAFSQIVSNISRLKSNLPNSPFNPFHSTHSSEFNTSDPLASRNDMESDDDFYSTSPLRESSPPVQFGKLKRLKKTRVSNEPTVNSIDDLLSLPQVDSVKVVELEYSKSIGIDDLSEESLAQSPLEGFGDEDRDLNNVFDEDRRETRRVLEFGDASGEIVETRIDRREDMEEEMVVTETDEVDKTLSIEEGGEGMEEDSNPEISGNKISNKEGSDEKNEKKKKKKRGESGDYTKQKSSVSNKRKEEKERKVTLQQLHAESQRLLRETRDAAFTPVPVQQKPISSILEKIRKRKLEVSIKTTSWNYRDSIAEISDEVAVSHVSESIYSKESPTDKLTKVIERVAVDGLTDVLNDHPQTSCLEKSEDKTKSTVVKASYPVAVYEETKAAFRAPLDDTQDLFTYSQTSDSMEELPSDQQKYTTEEVMAPSLLARNLKFDSAPVDDLLSDEEDEDKENVEAQLYSSETEHSSPRGATAKAFLDDEAIEEDDSDNELFRFKLNEEDDDLEDSEELKDMIATNYEEAPIDKDKRNELHQKWLEQQDAAGTDNLLQRLNYGTKFSDDKLLNEETDDDDDDTDVEEEFDDDVVPIKFPKMSSKKAKEMIAQTFNVKDDDEAFLSDEEETEKMIVQMRILHKVEEKVTLLSPAEDESSRQVFGLIKKLNIVSDTKKKAKSSSFFDTMLTGGNSSSSSRSSFLGRTSSHSLPSSRKKGSSTSRSFIFGRDDSNSRGSMSATEDSLQTMPKEKESEQIMSTSSKISSSQAKFSSFRKKKGTSEAANGTSTRSSLFEILKRSSSSSGKSNSCKQDHIDDTIGLTQFAAFKIPKRPVKMDGLRSLS